MCRILTLVTLVLLLNAAPAHAAFVYVGELEYAVSGFCDSGPCLDFVPIEEFVAEGTVPVTLVLDSLPETLDLTVQGTDGTVSVSLSVSVTEESALAFAELEGILTSLGRRITITTPDFWPGAGDLVITPDRIDISGAFGDIPGEYIWAGGIGGSFIRVPEPGTLLLLALAVVGVFALKKRHP